MRFELVGKVSCLCANEAICSCLGLGLQFFLARLEALPGINSRCIFHVRGIIVKTRLWTRPASHPHSVDELSQARTAHRHACLPLDASSSSRLAVLQNFSLSPTSFLFSFFPPSFPKHNFSNEIVLIFLMP